MIALRRAGASELETMPIRLVDNLMFRMRLSFNAKAQRRNALCLAALRLGSPFRSVEFWPQKNTKRRKVGGEFCPQNTQNTQIKQGRNEALFLPILRVLRVLRADAFSGSSFVSLCVLSWPFILAWVFAPLRLCAFALNLRASGPTALAFVN